MQVEETKSIISRKELEIPYRLQQSINSIIKKEDYISYEVEKKVITTVGGNFLGVLYEINVKGKTRKGAKETNVFVKHIIPGGNLKLFSLTDIYLREMFAYNNLSKIFTELQEEANVPLKERYKMVKSYDETYSEAIILENVAKKGFKTPSRMESISLKFAELSIQQLAAFHGLSYVIEKKQPKFFEAKIKTIKQPYKLEEEYNNFFYKMIDLSVKCLENDVKEILIKNIPTLLEKYRQYTIDDTSTGCCLGHGDFRVDNILMKQTDNEITEVIVIDYQLMHYRPPMLDFMYFIFCSTDQQFRIDHLEHLKDFYYKSLKNFLNYFDLDIESIYSRKVYEEMFKKMLDYGLIIGLQILPFILNSGDDVPDWSQNTLAELKFSLDSRFEDRVKGIVDDFIKWGYIN